MPTGRPTILDAAMAARIEQLMVTGCTVEDAAAAAGCSRASIMGWQARGRDEQRRRSQGFEPTESEQPFLDFLDAITRARAAAKVTMIGHVATAAQTDWRAAAWYLERVDRAQFGKYVDLEKLDAAQIEDLIAELDDELEQGPEPPAALPAAGESSTALRGGIQSEP